MSQNNLTHDERTPYRVDLTGKRVYIPRLDKVGRVVSQLPSGEIEKVKVNGKTIDVINEIIELIPTVWDLIKVILQRLKLI